MLLPESINSGPGRTLPAGLECEDFGLEAVPAKTLEGPDDRVFAFLIKLQVGLGHPDARLEVLVAVLVDVDLEDV